MCGIAGIWSERAIGDPVGLAGRFDAALAHRGPDGHAHSTHDNARLLLVHRRLAILDPGAAGEQPMRTPDERHTMVFNGEIYNHAALRRALEQQGEQFTSRCDTEVLLRLVARRGPEALAGVRGMFALAMWDAAERTLLVARDRFGIKPLYVTASGGRLAFASELRALLHAGVCDRTIDPAAVLAFLRWGSIPGPLTWLRDSIALEPGTWRRWSSDRSSVCGRFADARDLWRCDSGSTGRSEADLRDATRAALADSLRAHLVADVPVGCFLSGGIDSSALVALASAQGRPLQTFTVVVDEATHSEERFAAETAQRFGTVHQTLRVNPALLLEAWPAVLRHMDQPTIDGLNSYVVSSAVAATGVKTVLSGIGGDEAFGGYPSFTRVPRGARLGRMPRGLRMTVANTLARRQPAWRGEKIRHAAAHADSTFELYRAVRGWLMPPEIATLAGPALQDGPLGVCVDSVEQAASVPAGAEHVHAAVARLETTMYLRHQLLRDADVMSMAHGLEVRVPFVDHELLSAVWPAVGAHPHLLQKKRLLVDSLGGAVPASIAARPKQGFTLPFEHWIDGPLSDFIQDGLAQAARAGWLSATAPDVVLRDWRARACHWSRPWGLAVLGHFSYDA